VAQARAARPVPHRARKSVAVRRLQAVPPRRSDRRQAAWLAAQQALQLRALVAARHPPVVQQPEQQERRAEQQERRAEQPEPQVEQPEPQVDQLERPAQQEPPAQQELPAQRREPPAEVQEQQAARRVLVPQRILLHPLRLAAMLTS